MGVRTMLGHLPPWVALYLRSAQRTIVPVRWYAARIASIPLGSMRDSQRRRRMVRLVRRVWGNPGYSASIELCEVIDTHIGPSSSVVEFGSGLTTLLLRRRVGRLGRVLTIEHDRSWARAIGAALPPGRRASLTVAPLVAVNADVDWYSVSPHVIEGFDVVICDGPPSHSTSGARSGLLWALAAISHEVTVIIDDVDRPEEAAMLDALIAGLGARMTARVNSEMGDVAVLIVPERRGSIR